MTRYRGYDAWSRDWLFALAGPIRSRRSVSHQPLPAPTAGLLSQVRSYLDGRVPG